MSKKKAVPVESGELTPKPSRDLSILVILNRGGFTVSGNPMTIKRNSVVYGVGDSLTDAFDDARVKINDDWVGAANGEYEGKV